jgi:hypothetical protein
MVPKFEESRLKPESGTVAGIQWGGSRAETLVRCIDTRGVVRRTATVYYGQSSTFGRPSTGSSKAAFHWFFFLQPGELVEKLLAANPDVFLDATLIRMAGSLDALHPAALADCRAAFRRPEVRAAIVKDYRIIRRWK